MARINIEDSLFRDARWLKLIVKLGCEHKALGIITSAWMLAQRNWLKHGSIPPNAWPNDLNILVDVELASKNEDGSVYIKGSKKAFLWLERNSKGGKSKSQSKLEQLNNARNMRDVSYLENVEPRLNLAEPTLNNTEDLTLTPTLTLIHKKKRREEVNTQQTISLKEKEEISSIEQRLFKTWGTRFSAKASLIYFHFGGLENFNLWVVEIEDAWKNKPKDYKEKTSLRRYFSSSLVKELEGVK